MVCNADGCAPCGDTETQVDIANLMSARGEKVVTLRWDNAVEADAEAAGRTTHAESARGMQSQRRQELFVAGHSQGVDAGDLEETPSCNEGLPARGTVSLAGLRIHGATAAYLPRGCSQLAGEGHAQELALGRLPPGGAEDVARVVEELPPFGHGEAGEVVMELRAGDVCAHKNAGEGLRKLTLEFGLPSARNDSIDARTARAMASMPLPSPASHDEDEEEFQQAGESPEDEERAVTEAPTLSSSAATDRQVAHTLLQARLPLRFDELKAPRRQLHSAAEAPLQDFDDSLTGSSPDQDDEASPAMLALKAVDCDSPAGIRWDPAPSGVGAPPARLVLL